MNGRPPKAPDYSIISAIGAIESPPKTSWLYQFNLLVVAVVMVLLPLVYLALVGFAGYGVYYHAVQHADWISTYGSRAGRGIILVFLGYIIPIIVGVVVVFFMIKPIFAGRPKRAQPLVLSPTDNPLLYAFIEKICGTVGAPSPKRIDLDCDLNASASFRRGFGSMFGNDLVLTIGLPLVANLSAAEFGGVVAHEFGHFTQSVGMRLSYLIRRVNFWFLRVVYERDAWDEALEAWSQNAEDVWSAMVVWTAQIGVGFARLILRVLMFIGLLIGGFMMRQMEYDADAWEIKLAGSATFERTQRKLATLSVAMEKMYAQIHAEWRKSQQLPDNLSELLRRYHESLSPAILQTIEDASGLEPTGCFDSHPSLADRIRQARRRDEVGVFHDDRPASDLFGSFQHPARFVTLLHYTDELGIPLTEDMLVRVEAKAPAVNANFAAAANAGSRGDAGLLEDYFLGVLPLFAPVKLPLVVTSMNYEADMTELLQITSSLQDVSGSLEASTTQYHEATERLIQVRTAGQLLGAGGSLAPKAYGLSEATLESVQKAEAEAMQECDALRHSLREVWRVLLRRLQLGLALCLAAPNDEVDSGYSNATITATLNRVALAANRFAVQQHLLLALNVIERLIALRLPGEDSRPLEQAIAAQLDVINTLHRGPAAKPAPARSGLKLKLSGPARHVEDEADLPQLRQETQRWLAGYRADLELLVGAVRSVEGIEA
jgi:Zn-dependent protease with chaperone function